MKSYISHWLLLVSVILQINQFRSDFVFGTFFYTLCIVPIEPIEPIVPIVPIVPIELKVPEKL